MEALTHLIEKSNADAKKGGDAAVTGSEQIIIGISLVAAFFLIISSLILSSRITAPLDQAVAVARRIAKGKLENNIVIKSMDETGQLLESLREMAGSLSAIVGEVVNSSTTIAEAASEISNGNASLSQRTEEQASSLEETASSMEEMTGTVKQNADSAAEAKQLADANRKRAATGAEVVHRTVQAMSEINESSTRIADIIGTIDGIAFQTNLLALNAAVEAARAGEQGRGFAVVASEVRSLAQRSADAAKEIKNLIGDSVNKVKAGTELVDESGKTLEEIIEGTQKVADIIAEIAAASIEQASGIDQVNNAVTQMDNMTQDNAALVEEAAAASKSLEDQAANLRNQMSFFKLDGLQHSLGNGRNAARGRLSSDTRGNGHPMPASTGRAHLDHLRRDHVTASKQDSSEWEQF
jgi:methyl-accepting chemotaxis protein